ncbi:MAG TPA: RDD family protein [Acidobacteriota bacterium]|nr:RDD family protein [Acidobacteriota bacterium]
MDWKSEIKKKLEEHAQKKQDLSAPQDEDPAQEPDAAEGASENGTEASEFTVSLGQRPTLKRPPNTFLRDETFTLPSPQELAGKGIDAPADDAFPPEEAGPDPAADTESEEDDQPEAVEAAEEEIQEKAAAMLFEEAPEAEDEEEVDEIQEADEADQADEAVQLELLERALAPDRKKGGEEAQDRSIVTFQDRTDTQLSPLDRPLQRGDWESDDPQSVSGGFLRDQSQEQGDETPDSSDSPYRNDFPDEDLDEADELWVPREIFVSRFLAGLVDLILASFTGLVFAFGASRLLALDLLTRPALEIGGILGLIFFLVGSVFFLRLSGQTPGMQLTELRVLHQESPSVPTGAALIRVLAFLPSLGLLFAGLLWGLFDPWARCLHDRLSQTRVVYRKNH